MACSGAGSLLQHRKIAPSDPRHGSSNGRQNKHTDKRNLEGSRRTARVKHLSDRLARGLRGFRFGAQGLGLRIYAQDHGFPSARRFRESFWNLRIGSRYEGCLFAASQQATDTISKGNSSVMMGLAQSREREEGSWDDSLRCFGWSRNRCGDL